MARYFAELSYNGTRFHGWQIQINAPSVQQAVEKALSALLGTPTEVVGAGRTDTGVHASFYVAHFEADETKAAESTDFRYHLNSMLPWDIAVHRIYRVRDDAHARFSALEREYRYFVTTVKDPFRRETACLCTVPLDREAMNRAAAMLLEYDDFTSFAKLHTDTKTNICRVTEAVFRREGTLLVFTIRADRFLRNMVRAVVGSLLEVGRGKRTPEDFRRIIECRNRGCAGSSAPAAGLFLTGVRYPDDILYKSDKF